MGWTCACTGPSRRRHRQPRRKSRRRVRWGGGDRFRGRDGGTRALAGPRLPHQWPGERLASRSRSPKPAIRCARLLDSWLCGSWHSCCPWFSTRQRSCSPDLVVFKRLICRDRHWNNGCGRVAAKPCRNCGAPDTDSDVCSFAYLVGSNRRGGSCRLESASGSPAAPCVRRSAASSPDGLAGCRRTHGRGRPRSGSSPVVGLAPDQHWPAPRPRRCPARAPAPRGHFRPYQPAEGVCIPIHRGRRPVAWPTIRGRDSQSSWFHSRRLGHLTLGPVRHDPANGIACTSTGGA